MRHLESKKWLNVEYASCIGIPINTLEEEDQRWSCLEQNRMLDWITNLVLKEYGKLRTDTAFFAYYSGKLFQQHTRVTGIGCQLVNMVRSRLADRFDCGSCSELRFIGYLFICLFLSLFIWDSEWGEDKGLHPLILSPNVGVASRSEPGAKGGKAFQVFPMGGRNPTT